MGHCGGPEKASGRSWEVIFKHRRFDMIALFVKSFFTAFYLSDHFATFICKMVNH